MIEIDDYNSEFFFEGEQELEEYNAILNYYDSIEYNSPTEEEKDFAYNIMIFEQCISTLRELGSKNTDLGVAAQSSIYEINKFINLYTKEN